MDKNAVIQDEEDVLYRILKNYSDSDKSSPVDEFIRQELLGSKLFTKNEIDEIVQTIVETISSNNQNYLEIKETKKKGLTSAHWFKDFLTKLTSGFSAEGRSRLISSIKNALNQSNLELANKMTSQEIIEIVKPLETDDLSEHHGMIIAKNLKNELHVNALVRTIAMEDLMTSTNDNKGENNVE